MERNWIQDVETVMKDGEVDIQLLEAAVLKESVSIDTIPRASGTRSSGDDGNDSLTWFKRFARRAICHNNNLRDDLKTLIGSPASSSLIAILSEVIWREFPSEFKAARFAAIATAINVLTYGLENFCDKRP